MTPDPRLTPANTRVAATHLRGQVTADAFVAGTQANITAPLTDLFCDPAKSRDRQLIYGDAVTVYETHGALAFVQSAKDNYVGYIDAATTGPAHTPTHFVATAGTHLYEAENFKSTNLMPLTLGAKITVTAERPKFWETPQGYIPKKHLRALDRPFTDPATVAQTLFGTPYLWGGNSRAGIDCSGLIQAALLACAIPCPGDSDLQRTWLGTSLDAGTKPQRNDLYFWKGHVGIMVDDTTLLHANAHHMAATYEPINNAILRIKTQGDGDVTAHKRL